MNTIESIHFRYFKNNMQSIAALLPLIPGATLVNKPSEGIMIYSFATLQVACIFHEVAQAKRNSSLMKTVFIAGGPHPSACLEETLEFFDYVVIGEGEATLPELINVLQKGEDIVSVRGIAFKKKDDIIFNGKRENIDLDNYPPFDPDITHSSIEISRGCPFNCSYCSTPQLFGNKMRHRSVDVISKYAKFLKDIRFTSPNAFAYGSDGMHVRIEKIESLLKALPHRSIFFGTFPSEIRPEFINDKLLELVSGYCANTNLSMGGQSGSQRILDRIHRGHTVEDIIIGAEKCLQHGFIPVVDFIFGLPYETEEDQLDTIRIIKWLTSKGAKVHSHYFMPLPGTELEKFLPAQLSRQVDKIMGKLALHGKASGVWSKVNVIHQSL